MKSLKVIFCFIILWLLIWGIGHLYLNITSPTTEITSLKKTTLLLLDPDTFMVAAIKGKYPKVKYFMIFVHIFFSLIRISCGVLAAGVIAIPVGVFITKFKLTRKYMFPLIRFMASVSPLAWIPFLFLTVGIGNPAAISLVFLSVFFLLTFATVNSIYNVNEEYTQLATSLGSSKWQTVIYVILPAIFPNLFVIFRINFFAAWMVILVAESVGVNFGLGVMILLARATTNYPLQIFMMILIGLVGFCVDHFLELTQHKLLWWHTDTTLGRRYVEQ